MVTRSSVRHTREEFISSTPVRLVDEIIARAFTERASDIHFEPVGADCRIRIRTDGILIPGGRYSKLMHEEVISRLKVLAGLRTDIKFLPQDGRFRVNLSNNSINIRISVVPSIHGEKGVLRLLPSTLQNHSLETLGFSLHNVGIISKNIDVPHGMILVVGPTGSGKTTTLYTLLQKKSPSDVSTVTLEDPVEYSVPNITQIPINTSMTYANALRAVVRQDPDVIMVGEIRDHLTAELATHVALTGHLLFSTLHTNDAVTVLPRLIDMGVEPFLVASTVRMIISQRLVRKICVTCKKEFEPSKIESEYLASIGILSSNSKFKIYKGVGCAQCKNTGYLGRTVLSETFIVDEKIKNKIMEKPSSDDLQKIAIEQGMVCLIKDAADKVINGITTCEEIAVVCNV